MGWLARQPGTFVFGHVFRTCAGLLLLLAGCVNYQLSDRGINFNDALQDLDNRQVLLNAVRASKRYPPYFTAISQINATGELDGSQLNLTVPFGPLGHNAYSANPMIKVGTGLTVSTNPLDTQEFYQGYMAPVKTSLIEYYLKQGWPYQLVYHAFFRRIDMPVDMLERIKFAAAQTAHCVGGFVDCPGLPISDRVLIHDQMPRCAGLAKLNAVPGSLPRGARNRDPVHFTNAPDDPCKFAEFQLLAAMLDILNTTVAQAKIEMSGPVPVTIPTEDKNISVKVQTGSSASDNANYGFVLDKVLAECARGGMTMAAAAPHAQAAAAHRSALARAEKPAEPMQTLMFQMVIPTQETKLPPPSITRPAGAVVPEACQDARETTIIIRSPEALVFYLGDLVSADLHPYKPGWRPMLATGQGHERPLFLVQKGAPAGEKEIVNVSLDGENYFISPEPDDYNNTMHFLTLVEQIIALQKKGSQFPSIPTVQVLGQ